MKSTRGIGVGGCGRIFSDKTGTVFERSRKPFRVRFFTALLLQYKVSILELSKTLNMYYDATYRVLKRLRESIYLNQIRVRLKGVVEVDEAYVNAGLKGKRGLSILDVEASGLGGATNTMRSQ